jgi:hypothetical protein
MVLLRLVEWMVFEVTLVVLALPLVAVELSLAWSRRLGRWLGQDADVEAAAMLRPWR